MKLYRGTQLEKAKGRQKVTSWTPSLAVAVIYSARPGDVWASRKTEFLPTSTVHSADLRDGAKVLKLCGADSNACAFDQMMRELEFGKPNGMTQEEGEAVLRGLHKRYMQGVGISGGPFNYAVFAEDQPDERLDPDDVPFDIRNPQTLISWVVLEKFEYDPWETAGLFVIDTFALADSSTVRNVARRLGYDAIQYEDVFEGGNRAAPDLLGCSVTELDGVHMGWDVSEEGDSVPLHETVRPLHKDTLVNLQATPSEELLPEVACEMPAANPTLKRKLLR